MKGVDVLRGAAGGVWDDIEVYVDAGVDADGEAKSKHKKSRHILAESQNLGQ